ncbi:MAG TPA: hypothetical protein GX700_18915 [Paracoccus sp.]|nr:hypothetical protein [Paracoccus sp. (in: a-proteobacteria)]
MQHFLIKADSKINDTPRPDLAAGSATGEVSAAEVFERARVTAKSDPTLKSIWDRLFDDS